MAYNPHDPAQLRHRQIMNNPLMVSPAERAWHAQADYQAEDRRRFGAADARFREAEAARRGQEAYRDQTARMAARGQYLNQRMEAGRRTPEPKQSPVGLGNGTVYDPERGVVVGEGGGWKLPDSLDDGQKATPFAGLPAPAPAPDVPKAPEIVDLGNGRRGYWNGREWVELSESSEAPASGPRPTAPADSTGAGRYRP